MNSNAFYSLNEIVFKIRNGCLTIKGKLESTKWILQLDKKEDLMLKIMRMMIKS